MVTRSIEVTPIPPEVMEGLNQLFGLECTLQRIGTDRSLFIGFGDVDTSTTKPHAAFEIGTYDCSWRVVDGHRVLCARDDAVDDVNELNQKFSTIKFGVIGSIFPLSELDVRIQFLNGVNVDVLCSISDDDQILHIFLPAKRVIRFSLANGWQMGRSDMPW
jgi:hypothetical protein